MQTNDLSLKVDIEAIKKKLENYDKTLNWSLVI